MHYILFDERDYTWHIDGPLLPCPLQWGVCVSPWSKASNIEEEKTSVPCLWPSSLLSYSLLHIGSQACGGRRATDSRSVGQPQGDLGSSECWLPYAPPSIKFLHQYKTLSHSKIIIFKKIVIQICIAMDTYPRNIPHLDIFYKRGSVKLLKTHFLFWQYFTIWLYSLVVLWPPCERVAGADGWWGSPHMGLCLRVCPCWGSWPPTAPLLGTRILHSRSKIQV